MSASPRNSDHPGHRENPHGNFTWPGAIDNVHDAGSLNPSHHPLGCGFTGRDAVQPPGTCGARRPVLAGSFELLLTGEFCAHQTGKPAGKGAFRSRPDFRGGWCAYSRPLDIFTGRNFAVTEVCSGGPGLLWNSYFSIPLSISNLYAAKPYACRRTARVYARRPVCRHRSGLSGWRDAVRRPLRAPVRSAP